jgi:hypothetical protein
VHFARAGIAASFMRRQDATQTLDPSSRSMYLSMRL